MTLDHRPIHRIDRSGLTAVARTSRLPKLPGTGGQLVGLVRLPDETAGRLLPGPLPTGRLAGGMAGFEPKQSMPRDRLPTMAAIQFRDCVREGQPYPWPKNASNGAWPQSWPPTWWATAV